MHVSDRCVIGNALQGRWEYATIKSSMVVDGASVALTLFFAKGVLFKMWLTAPEIGELLARRVAQLADGDVHSFRLGKNQYTGELRAVAVDERLAEQVEDRIVYN